VFLKKYSPRIIHLIGSPGYNTDGTLTLGYATNGTKITLQAVNWLDYRVIEGTRGLNYLFFHTMHHEFTHILDQTISHPQAFNIISTGLYNSDWNNTPEEIANSNGFVTAYASANTTEDWAETVSNYVTMNQDVWDNMMMVADFDWESIDFRDNQQRDSIQRLNNLTKTAPDFYNIDSIGYAFKQGSGEYKWVRKAIVRDAMTNAPVTDANGNIQYLHNKTIKASDIITQKVELARLWLKDNYQIDIDELRKEVQTRQYLTNDDGDFIKVPDVNGNLQYVNRLAAPDPENPGQSFMETLLKTVDAFKDN
jgi:hypothetical protein